MGDTRLRQPGRARRPEARKSDPRAPVSAERRIEQLQDSIEAHRQRNRMLQAQLKLVERSVAHCAEMESELSELKGEIRELTRANREHVKRNEALQSEIVKLKALSRKSARPVG